MTGSSWVATTQLLPCSVDGKHPVDAGSLAIATAFPLRDLRDQDRFLGDAAVEALADHHADLDLHHVEPARVLRREMELETAQDASGFGRLEALV